MHPQLRQAVLRGLASLANHARDLRDRSPI